MSVSKLTTDDAKDFNPYHLVGYLINIIEVRMINDVMMGEIFVIDLDNLHFAHLSKLTPTVLKKMFMPAEVIYYILYRFLTKQNSHMPIKIKTNLMHVFSHYC